MRLFSVFLLLACVAPPASAQTSSSNVVAYQNRCASCHGATMTGASAPAILTYIRYHTDSEVTATIRERHRSLQAVSVPDSDLPAIMAGMRELSGTNPAMATGGFTGRRGGPGDAGGGGAAIGGRGAAAPSPGPARGSSPAAAATTSGADSTQQTTIKMVDGRSRTGVLLAQSEVSAVLLENGHFQLLSKDGSVYREKAITPKADWTHYDGSLTGNRYSPLELINPSNVQRRARPGCCRFRAIPARFSRRLSCRTGSCT